RVRCLPQRAQPSRHHGQGLGNRQGIYAARRYRRPAHRLCHRTAQNRFRCRRRWRPLRQDPRRRAAAAGGRGGDHVPHVQLKRKQAIGQDPGLSFPSLPAVYFAGAKPPENVELTFWTSVKDSGNPAVLNTYLQRYPEDGKDLAEAKRIEEQQRAEIVARTEEL